MVALVFLTSFLPGLFYLWIVWRQDKYDPEPKKWIAFTFFLGMLSTFPAALAEQVVDIFVFPFWESSLKGDFYSVYVSSFFVIGPVEEFFKMWAILAVASNKNVFDEPMDALVYGAAASLGFASLENAMYCIRFGSDIYVVRALLTVPGHILFATAWAWGVGMWRFRLRGFGGFLVFLGCFFLSVLFHGIYDALLLTRNPFLVTLVLPLMAVMGVLTFLAFYHFRKISPFRWSILPPGLRTVQQLSVQQRLERGLSVGWVAGGTLIYVLLTAAIFLLSGAVGAVLSGGKAVVLNFLDPRGGPIMVLTTVLLTVVLGVSFFAAGVLIGRISAKKTIFEPAIASSIALALLFVMLAPRSGSSSLLMFLFMGPIFFGLSCLGGWLGEAWQERAERRRGS
jgi:RsiW-degrading membrane proteinase PrsW (M82 family)